MLVPCFSRGCTFDSVQQDRKKVAPTWKSIRCHLVLLHLTEGRHPSCQFVQIVLLMLRWLSKKNVAGWRSTLTHFVRTCHSVQAVPCRDVDKGHYHPTVSSEAQRSWEEITAISSEVLEQLLCSLPGVRQDRVVLLCLFLSLCLPDIVFIYQLFQFSVLTMNILVYYGNMSFSPLFPVKRLGIWGFSLSLVPTCCRCGSHHPLGFSCKCQVLFPVPVMIGGGGSQAEPDQKFKILYKYFILSLWLNFPQCQLLIIKSKPIYI